MTSSAPVVAALVLAAGASTRLGQPKQIVRINGETLLDRAIRIARQAGCSPIAVVLGAAEQEVRANCHLDDVQIVINPNWTEGMGSSIACGVDTLRDADGIVILTCDMPAITSDHLRKLSAAGKLTASAYAGRKGVPAFFPREYFPKLLALKGDTGAREILQQAEAIPLENGEQDIDRPEDLL